MNEVLALAGKTWGVSERGWKLDKESGEDSLSALTLSQVYLDGHFMAKLLKRRGKKRRTIAVVRIGNRSIYRLMIRHCNKRADTHPAARSRGVFHSPMTDRSIPRHLRHHRAQHPIATWHRAHALLARYRGKRRHGCQCDQQNARHEFGEVLHSFSIVPFADLEACDLNHTMLLTPHASFWSCANRSALSETTRARRMPSIGSC